MINPNFELRISNFDIIRLLRSPWTGESLPADVDALALAQDALAQGVGPLLYGRLRGHGFLPPAAEEPLRQAYYATAAHNARLLHELAAVLGALSAAGLPTLVLKGAALALAVYENPALRPMGDIDLLVRPADADAALAALAGLGYHPSAHEPAPGSIRTYENEIMLRRPGASTPLEVHWGLFDSPYHQHHMPMDWFWETAVPIPQMASPLPSPTDGARAGGAAEGGGGGVKAIPPRMLGPAAQVLHLCAHLALHHGGPTPPRLLWLHDVAEAVVHWQAAIDWPALLAQAAACDLLVPLQQVLPRAARDWRAPVPSAVLAELERLAASPAEERLMARLAAGHRPAGRRLWDDLRDTPSWRRRLHMAWVNAFPTPTYMRQRYDIRHPLLTPLYYPYRWFLGLKGLFVPRRR